MRKAFKRVGKYFPWRVSVLVKMAEAVFSQNHPLYWDWVIMDQTLQILDSEETLKYRISAKGVAISAIVLALFLLTIWLVMNYLIFQVPISPFRILLLVSPGIFITMIPSMWFFTTLEIDNKGMRLYRVNAMKWDEVVSAKQTNLLGLKYLRVTRRKGMKLSIPLYLNGPQPIEVALKEKCPAENPIHQLLTSESRSQ